MIGTFRADRPAKLWSHLKVNIDGTPFQRGDLRMAWAMDAPLAAICWRDAGTVRMVTNFIDPDGGVEATRWRNTAECRTQGGQAKVNYHVPAPVHFYRNHMHQVDSMNGAIMSMRVHHRAHKYYTPIWWSVLKMAVVNSWAMLRDNKRSTDPVGSAISQKDFIKCLCKRLTAGFSRCSEQTTPARDAMHLPEKMLVAKVCVSCLWSGIRSNTSYRCTGCDKFVHPDCMLRWHDRLIEKS